MSPLQRVLNIYAPARCVSCYEHGSSLCHGCMADISPNLISRCFLCAKQTDEFATCTKCLKKTPVKNVWVATDYSGTVKELLHGFKYERERTSALELAAIVDRSLPYLSSETIVTHIPTASSRARARGYDHSRLLAKELAKLRGLKHKTLLGRLGQSQQMGATRKQRLEQTKNSYVATKKLNKAEVLLVDDVLTTGATLTAAGKELRRAGAKNVYAAVVAHHSTK